MKNNLKKRICVIGLIVLINLVSGCDVKKNTINDYNEFAYVKLQNNNDASLEIKNQLIFLRKQLQRKNQGKQYSSTIAENIIVLSNIKSSVESLGTFGRSYEITEAILQKWEKWYSENAQYLSYNSINGKEVIAVNYPDGRRIVSPN